ncbi:hypothetical protein NK214_21320 [Chromobacterium sp. S0633]|uniref:hypothetical protein n=1 Tax=Chromobacterium sp. S0633 TaxID=2957805 RepID=UPI0020A04B63|nr:hypothetical protein [Chromobacterium sp. S0633]MCP1292725.1 hypothetical protein [Chromobacterium sp. S0633]
MPQSLFPRRRRYRTPALETQEVLLPFVIRLPGRTYPHYWHMPSAPATPAQAQAYGRECAAHLLQWFKDNPAYVGQGLLSRVARDIDFSRTEQRGYWLGFFNHLERLISLSARRMNVYAYTDHQHRMMDAQVERSLLERQVLKKSP